MEFLIVDKAIMEDYIVLNTEVLDQVFEAEAVLLAFISDDVGVGGP